MANLKDVNVKNITLKEILDFAQKFNEQYPALRVEIRIPNMNERKALLQ